MRERTIRKFLNVCFGKSYSGAESWRVVLMRISRWFYVRVFIIWWCVLNWWIVHHSSPYDMCVRWKMLWSH